MGLLLNDTQNSLGKMIDAGESAADGLRPVGVLAGLADPDGGLRWLLSHDASLVSLRASARWNQSPEGHWPGRDYRRRAGGMVFQCKHIERLVLLP